MSASPEGDAETSSGGSARRQGRGLVLGKRGKGRRERRGKNIWEELREGLKVGYQGLYGLKGCLG